MMGRAYGDLSLLTLAFRSVLATIHTNYYT